MRRTDKGFAKTPTSTKSTLRKPTIQYNDGGIPIINSLEDIKFSWNKKKFNFLTHEKERHLVVRNPYTNQLFVIKCIEKNK